MMRNNGFFRTALFNNTAPKQSFVNPNCFGDDAAAWLIERLRGEFALDEATAEDYGWGFWIANDYWVAIAIADESIGAEIADWRVSVDYDAGLNLRKRLFGKPNRDLQRRICAAIHNALASEPQISEIRWCDDAERDCGDKPT